MMHVRETRATCVHPSTRAHTHTRAIVLAGRCADVGPCRWACVLESRCSNSNYIDTHGVDVLSRWDMGRQLRGLDVSCTSPRSSQEVQGVQGKVCAAPNYVHLCLCVCVHAFAV